MPQPKDIDYQTLLEFCTTDRQREVVTALVNNNNNVTQLAKKLGVCKKSVKDVVDAVVRNAARRGYAPDFDRRHIVPETERIKGVSTLYDGDVVDKQWVKTEKAPDDEPKPATIDAPIIRQATYTDGTGKVVGQWNVRVSEQQKQIDGILAAIKEHVEEYKGLAGRVRSPRRTLSQGLLEVYPIGDSHIGMMAHEDESGANFDLKIAARDLETAIDLLVERATPAKNALIINLGDYFHANDHSQLTPGHKHKLDVDSRPHKIMRVGFYLMRTVVQRVLQVHDHVDVWNVAGNHDPLLALALSLFLEAIFSNEPRVTVHDNAAPYYYKEFGANMIMAAHGHLAKMSQLQGIASSRQPQMWGRTKFRHAFTGHVHHDRIVELDGMKAESVRILAPKDSYAAGAYNSTQGIHAVTFHEQFGLISRREVGIDMVRARQAGAL